MNVLLMPLSTFLSKLLWQYSLVAEELPVSVDTHQAIEKHKSLENNNASVIYILENILTEVTNHTNFIVIWD
jgi:hypothetical protein